MQIDKLVQLLESPVFVHLRLQLLDVESPHHAPLLKSCYGLLMLLPQSDAYRSLSDRLTAVCNLRDNLGIPPTTSAQDKSRLGLLSKQQLDLLAHFDKIMDLHRRRERRQLGVHDGMVRTRNTISNGASTKSSARAVVGGATNSTPAPVFYSGNDGGGSSTSASPPPNIRGGARVTQEV